MVYIEMSRVMDLASWYNSTPHKKNESMLRTFIKNYDSAYIDCGEKNTKYIREIAKNKDTYMLCVIPRVDQIKSEAPELSTKDASSLHAMFVEFIRTWAEMSGIPIYKVHFVNSLSYIEFCYSRDILIDSDKTRVRTWNEHGGVGILEKN